MILVLLLIVLNSKHLHIFTAPVNVYTSRRPNALGPLQPIMFDGKPLDFEDPPEEALFGKGHISEFTWKNYVDFMACTECGRCQDQCPAWNTEKPLSPKLLIMDLRDNLFESSDYLLAAKGSTLGSGEFDEKALAGLDFRTTGITAATIHRRSLRDRTRWHRRLHLRRSPRLLTRTPRDRKRRSVVLHHVWRVREPVSCRH